MKQILGFATGNIWDWHDDNNVASLFRYMDKLNINGIELTLGTKEQLYHFKPTKKQVNWLRSLDYVSIHAPFRLVRRADNEEEIVKQLNYIQKFYDLIKAKNLIIHPTDLPKPSILRNYDFKVSTENLTPEKHFTIPVLKKLLQKCLLEKTVT
jgi:hypothetical protein